MSAKKISRCQHDESKITIFDIDILPISSKECKFKLKNVKQLDRCGSLEMFGFTMCLDAGVRSDPGQRGARCECHISLYEIGPSLAAAGR